MARLIGSSEPRPWDDKAEEVNKTKPLSREEFLSLHVNIWGSLEFCRSCHSIVYNGECSQCKDEDTRGRRYKIDRLRNSDGTGIKLIDQHLARIKAQGGSSGLLTDSATTTIVDFGQLPRRQFEAHIVMGGPGQPQQPVINWMGGADIAPDQQPPPPNEVAYRINNPPIDALPLADYNEPPDGNGENPPEEMDEDFPI